MCITTKKNPHVIIKTQKQDFIILFLLFFAIINIIITNCIASQTVIELHVVQASGCKVFFMFGYVPLCLLYYKTLFIAELWNLLDSPRK